MEGRRDRGVPDIQTTRLHAPRQTILSPEGDTPSGTTNAGRKRLFLGNLYGSPATGGFIIIIIIIIYVIIIIIIYV